MKRSERFRKFSEISTGLENNAGAKLAAGQAQLEAQQKQLKELKSYLGEYQLQLQQKLDDSDSALVINGYQQFISSLNGAIALQTEIVRKSELQVAELRRAWIEKRVETSKYEQAAETFQYQEDAQSSKIEQAENDDRVSSRYHSAK